MCGSRNHGNRFQQTDGYRCAGAAILPDLVERRVRDIREREDRRNEPKLILRVMSIRRWHVSLSQAAQCRPQVVHTRHREHNAEGDRQVRDEGDLVRAADSAQDKQAVQEGGNKGAEYHLGHGVAHEIAEQTGTEL
jgi:hypothetical protein